MILKTKLKETNKRIYAIDNDIVKRWEKETGKKFKDILHEIINLGNRKRRLEFYKTIPLRTNYKKRLSGCKIDKNKVCIQK